MIPIEGVELGPDQKPARGAGLVRRVMSKPVGAACVVFLIVIAIIAVVAPLIWPDALTDVSGDLANTLAGPSLEHPLGTDALGRDVLIRLLVGTRVTMLGVVQVAVVVFVIGVPLGLLAGYVGGWADRTIGWFTDLAFAMPGIIIALLVLAIYPDNMLAAMTAVGVLISPSLIRVVRSVTIAVRAEPYVEAVQVAGLSTFYIITRHVLLRVTGPIVVQMSLVCAYGLLAQTGLSFLGVLVAAPAPSWGGMMADGLRFILQQPFLMWPPGVITTLTVLAFGLLGDTIRDAFTEKWMPPSRRKRKRKSVTAVAAGAERADAEEAK